MTPAAAVATEVPPAVAPAISDPLPAVGAEGDDDQAAKTTRPDVADSNLAGVTLLLWFCRLLYSLSAKACLRVL